MREIAAHRINRAQERQGIRLLLRFLVMMCLDVAYVVESAGVVGRRCGVTAAGAGG
jgi:hypothetical protein